MRLLPALVIFATLNASPAAAADALAEARRFYNLGDYDAAAEYAREAIKVPGTAASGRLVLGRVLLELYRRSADHTDLIEARDALRSVDADELGPSERVELTIGVGEYLYLEDRFGIAAETFERVLDASLRLGPEAHERVLDWWATALDRLALSRPREIRGGIYARIVSRMEKELAEDPGSAPAAYWLSAALRGTGDLERAWHAARAGWITALLGRDRGAALRADLDRLIVQGIIPERAALLQPTDSKAVSTSMLAEWEALKGAWSR